MYGCKQFCCAFSSIILFRLQIFEVLNFRTHIILRNLRPRGTKTRGIPKVCAICYCLRDIISCYMANTNELFQLDSPLLSGLRIWMGFVCKLPLGDLCLGNLFHIIYVPHKWVFGTRPSYICNYLLFQVMCSRLLLLFKCLSGLLRNARATASHFLNIRGMSTTSMPLLFHCFIRSRKAIIPFIIWFSFLRILSTFVENKMVLKIFELLHG